MSRDDTETPRDDLAELQRAFARRRLRRRKIALTAAAALALVVAGLAVWYSGVLGIRGERVTIRSGDVTLSGMLASPRFGDGPFPAAVVVHGSGAVRWKDLRGYARHLVPEGMAVLMYDKRGVGSSSGSFSVVGVQQSATELGALAGDALAAVAWLRERGDIDRDRVGLVGGSQAGWIMPLAASRSADVAFVVAIAGPAVTYGQEIYYSQLTGDDPGPFRDLSDAEIDRRLAAFDGPHGYDPAPVLRELRVPSLWVVGDSDRSVPMKLTVDNLERARLQGGLPLTIQRYPSGDHSLRDIATGRRIPYWEPLRGWLRDHGFLAPAP